MSNAILLRKVHGVLSACIRGRFLVQANASPSTTLSSIALALCLLLVPGLAILGLIAAFLAPTPTVATGPEWLIPFAAVGALKTGTHTVADLLENSQTADQVDLAVVNDVLQADLAAHNALMEDMLSEIAETTTERQLAQGVSDSGEMVPADEFSRPPTQKPAGVQTIGLPLLMFQYAIGWTRKWLQSNTVADMARATLAAQKAHRKKVLAELKRSIFLSANYNFTDYLVAPKGVTLGVKRFFNADSTSIPEGPNGEVFDGATHTHYVATATLTTVGADAAINTVVEHGNGGQIRIVIAQANEAAWRALTGFVAYLDPRLTLGTQANQPGQRLDITRLDNRAIGLYGAAEIWVKPWGVAGFAFVYDQTVTPKPVAFRQRPNGQTGLNTVAKIALYPWEAEYMEAEFGFGVRNRSAGAIYSFLATPYVDPTITG